MIKMTEVTQNALYDQNVIQTEEEKTHEPIEIRSVYSSTGTNCIKACKFDKQTKFDKLVIEVPKDETIYNEAVSEMQKMIDKMQIPNINVQDFIRRGYYTLDQADRIVESGKLPMIKKIAIDDTNVAIICTLPIGLSTVVTTYLYFLHEKTEEEAIKHGLYCMIALGGEKMVTYLFERSEKHSKLQEPLTQMLISAGYNVDDVDKAALSKHLRKEFLVKNLVKKGIIKIAQIGLSNAQILAIGLAVNLFQMVREKKSGEYVAKKAVDTAAGITGAVAGSTIGAAVGSAILPIGGTVIGGIIGGIVGGATSGKVSSVVTSKFVKSDRVVFEKFVKEFVEIEFSNLAVEFLLVDDEIDRLIKIVGKELVKSKKGVSMQYLRNGFISKSNKFKDKDNTTQYARRVLIPYFRKMVSERKELDTKIFSIFC